jgi:hypothetical protein
MLASSCAAPAKSSGTSSADTYDLVLPESQCWYVQRSQETVNVVMGIYYISWVL